MSNLDSRRSAALRVVQGLCGMNTLFVAGNSWAAQREFDLAGKSELSIALPCTVRIEQGAVAKMVVEAEADVLSAIALVTGVKSAQLLAHRNIRSKKPIVVKVTMPSLVRFAAEAAVNANFGSWKSASFSMLLDGSSSADFDALQTDELVVDLRGASSLVGKGTARRQTYRIDGAGNVDARAIRGVAAQVVINGTGEVFVHADQTLNAEISGVGTIRYAGQPKITKKINGVGSVEPL